MTDNFKSPRAPFGDLLSFIILQSQARAQRNLLCVSSGQVLFVHQLERQEYLLLHNMRRRQRILFILQMEVVEDACYHDSHKGRKFRAFNWKHFDYEYSGLRLLLEKCRERRKSFLASQIVGVHQVLNDHERREQTFHL